MTNVLTRDVIMSEAAALATNEAKGSNAKIELCMSMAQAAQARTVTPNDAGAIFESYIIAKTNATVDATAVTNKKATGSKVTEGYAAKTKSEWKQILICGAHPSADGVEALSIARDVALSKSLHVYDALIKIARVQQKKANTLTREDIEAALNSEETEKDTSELKRLKDLAKQMEKVYNGTESTEEKQGLAPCPSTELKQAIDLINARIRDIEPKTEDAVKALMSAGFTEMQARATLGRRI